MQWKDRIQLGILLAALATAGCGGGLYPPPPRTVEQYESDRARPGGGYARRTVVLYNLQRAMDPNRSTEARVKSIEVVSKTARDERWVQQRLAEILEEPSAPAEVTEAVVEILLAENYPGLAGKVADLLPKLPPGSALRGRLIGWIDRNAGDDALGEVVVLWAREPANSIADARFRAVAEQLTGKRWPQALVDAINSDAFEAKGSALEVLRARMEPGELQKRFREATPVTAAVTAIQEFLERFDYLPRTGEDLVTMVQLLAQEKEAMSPASKLYRRWASRDGYEFRLHDFHLLTRLSMDPLRKDIPRQQLQLNLGQELRSRDHVSHKQQNRGQKVKSDFWSNADQLSTADLWRLYLLNEMLTNKNIQDALYVTARRDRADKQSSWGGLVRYISGRARAYYYRPSVEAAGNDQVYVPSRRAYRDARNSLCWFLSHFSKISNADQSGPDEDELASMAQRGQSGVIFTSLSDETFAAHWYNQDKVVVSLGVLPYGR